jgi:prepilin-type N-terminal cleavage/methylation domain-containing protein
MKVHKTKSKRMRGQSGITMLELMIAMVVLAVGLAGVMLLVTGSMTNNNRNKLDTTATTLSQMVLERIAAAGPAATATFNLVDCTNVPRQIDPTGSTAGLGAPLDGSGNINFTAAPVPATYSVNYVVCGANGTQTTYEIRWRAQLLPANLPAGSVTGAKLISVSSQKIASAGGPARLFARPVTLRTVVTQ